MNLIEHLPRNSAFVEAQADDEDAARLLIDRRVELGLPRERWSEWSPERDGLARIQDLLQEVVRAIVASAGGKPGTFSPALRPVTALQRVRNDRRHEQHRRLVARLVPSTSEELPE